MSKDQSAVQGSRTCLQHEFAKARKTEIGPVAIDTTRFAQERLIGRRKKTDRAQDSRPTVLSLQTAARGQRCIFVAKPKPVFCQRPCQATKRGASGKLRNSNRLRCAERHREFPAR